MALPAIYLGMFAFKGIICFGMIEEIHGTHRQKTAFPVAFYAIVAILPVMNIPVAGNTSIFVDIFTIPEDCQWVIGSRMAPEAIYFIVGTSKGKHSGIVVKIPLPLKIGKGGFGMALCTTPGYSPPVGVFVATHAICKGYPTEFLEFLTAPHSFFVAFNTVQGFMGTLQGIVGFVVVKFRSGAKTLHIVAIQAIRVECFLMVVVMAG
jgi:hypothetical protein